MRQGMRELQWGLGPRWLGWGGTAGQVRVGDAEREAAVTALGEHYAAGRLTLEEYDQRTSHAFSARTAADLWRLFCDLPALPPPPEPSTERSSRFSLAPVLLVVIALVVLTQVPWPVALVVGYLWFGQVHRRWSRERRGPGTQTIGNRRAVRGTCS